jgi:hypothetical protein
MYSAAAKVDFCKRLGPQWPDLCDVLGTPLHERDSFPQGHEARKIWEWLERRNQLDRLPNALDNVGRSDLARALEGQIIVYDLSVLIPRPPTVKPTIQAAFQQPKQPRIRYTILAAIGASVLLIAVASFVVAYSISGDSGDKRAGDSASTPNTKNAKVVYELESEVLRSSSVLCSGHQDKFDLDTNERGHGDQKQIPGCTAAGRRADLILDPERLHAPSDDPLMIYVGKATGVDFEYCSKAVVERRTDLTGSIPLSKLDAGDYLCMKTDEGLVAVVRITELTENPVTLTFNGTVWKPLY